MGASRVVWPQHTGKTAITHAARHQHTSADALPRTSIEGHVSNPAVAAPERGPQSTAKHA
eukprot:355556-Chlamydomonas_euryale.AAC.1